MNEFPKGKYLTERIYPALNPGFPQLDNRLAWSKTFISNDFVDLQIF